MTEEESRKRRDGALRQGLFEIVIGEPSDDCPLCQAFGLAPSRANRPVQTEEAPDFSWLRAHRPKFRA